MRWLTLVLAGCLAVMAWARTIPVVHERPARTADDLRRSLDEIGGDLLRADAAYREFAVADSVLPLLPDTPGVTVAVSGAERRAASVLVPAAKAEAASITQSRARVGVFLIDDAFARHDGIPARVNHSDREVYTGTDEVGPYCAMVGTGRTENDEIVSNAFRYTRRSAERGLLGPCRFVALYGVPGPAIARWIASGAHVIAESPGQAPVAWDSRDLSRGFLLWTGGDLRMRACAGGRTDRCADILTRPTAWFPAYRRNLPGGAATFNMQPLFEYDLAPYSLMLSSIEAEFGEERFARFWTSDREVPDAFAAAFGVDVGAWVGQWSRSTYGELRLGAIAPTTTVLVSFLVALAFSGLAVALAERRTL